jgi:hypothetical protein
MHRTKENNYCKNVNRLKPFRLPLRHEVGERAGVRWSLGDRGSRFFKKQDFDF